MPKPLNKKKASGHPRQSTPKPLRAAAQSPLGPVDPREIELIRSTGTAKRGGGIGGEAWIIYAKGKRAGTIFINFIDAPPLGPHPSLQIFLNRASQGRQIGRVAYRLACEASQYKVIYAHISKSNIASRRAAEEAGFINATPPGYPQLIFVRSRGYYSVEPS